MVNTSIYAKIVLFENSIFKAVTSSKQMLSTCSEKCRRSIKNGPDYQHKVTVCTSTCKIRGYLKLLNALGSLRGSSVNEEVLNKKISYFQQQLAVERQKYTQFRQGLKKRQNVVPVSQSLKPSPERWDPKKLN